MNLRSSLSTGRVTGTEVDMYLRPLNLTATVKGVVALHGAGGTGAWPRLVNDSGASILRRIAQNRILVTSDAGGSQAWGNDAAISATGDLAGWAVALGAESSKVILVGASMGGLTAFNYAASNPSNVACIVALIPICDLNDVHANNLWGYAATIDTAYGGTYVNATERTDHNPAYFATAAGGSNLAGIPTRIYYSTGDTIARPQPAVALAEAIGKTASTVVIGNMEHSDASLAACDTFDILEFIAAHS